MENKIENFFFAGNAVSGEPDYRLAETFVRTSEAFANATDYINYIYDSNITNYKMLN